jgi:hypothetical protein
MKTSHFGEVLESSLYTWLGQSWQWDYFPPFGSMVTITSNNRILFGIVYQMQTSSIDPTRYPVAYQKTEQELLQEQPQIFEFLHTTFSCLSVGYLENSQLYYQIAPEPPKIHSFIKHASPEDIKHFFSDIRFLHLLFSHANQVLNLDELLLALLKQLLEQNILTSAYCAHFIATFSLLAGNDYRRLRFFLQRVQPLVSSLTVL